MINTYIDVIEKELIKAYRLAEKIDQRSVLRILGIEKNQTVEKVRKSLELAIKNSKIQVINKEAEIVDENLIKAGEEIQFFNSKLLLSFK